MPYKSFLFIQDDIDDVTRQKKFELVGEIDSHGNLVPGNPNLNDQHRTRVAHQKAAEPVANVDREEQTQAAETPAQEAPKRRGRRPAQVTLQETQA